MSTNSSRQQSTLHSLNANQRPHSDETKVTLKKCQGERNRNQAKPSTTSAESCSETSESEEAQDKHSTRKVQWANPQSLNWSFHEGSEDNTSRERGQFKRWNSSSDLVNSFAGERHHYEQWGEESPINDKQRDNNSLRDPPGHHIESPSANNISYADKNVASQSRPLCTTSSENLQKQPALTCVKVHSIQGTHGAANVSLRTNRSEKLNRNKQTVPDRRTKSSSRGTSPTKFPRKMSSQDGGTEIIQQLNLSNGSSDGSKERSARCHTAPVTASLAVAGHMSVDGREARTVEMRSVAKADWVLKEKENVIRKSNTTIVPEIFVSKRAQDDNSPNNDTEADNSTMSKSTVMSSESASFALQISQNSLSSSQSVDSSFANNNHRNHSATASIMASATLTLNVLQARRLMSSERKMFGRMKPAEPFVEFYLGGKLCGKTGIAHRSINPVWKENEIVCEIGGEMAKELSDQIETLELRIYDRKSKKENFMGAVTIALPSDDIAKWYNVLPRSEHADGLFCAGATGALEVKVLMTARCYPELKREHILVLKKNSKIVLDLSWTLSSSLDTSCVATDHEDGLILWEESVYFANRTNPNRSIVFPDRLELPGHPKVDTLILDLYNVPKVVGTLCVVLTARDGPLIGVESFEVRCKDAMTGHGIGRFAPRFGSLATSAILLRIARAKKNKAWDLEVMEKGYIGFREFGSMLPEIQVVSQGVIAQSLRTVERIALMRAGDSIRIQDYVSALPKILSVGLFWKAANGENVLQVALMFDKNAHYLEVVHRMNTQSQDSSVTYHQGKFDVNLNIVSNDIKYVCFSLGPYLGEQADHISTAAFLMLNSSDGKEIARTTIPDFDQFPTRTVTLGCFYRSVESWDFMVLGISSSDSTIDECTATLQKYLIASPPEPSSSLILRA